MPRLQRASVAPIAALTLSAAREHHLDGNSFPMEMHLVNKGANGRLAMVGVLLRRGAKNETPARLRDWLPGRDAAPEGREVDLAAL